MKSIRLIIDDGILDIYYKDYFKKYPRRKKRTIVHAVPMSLNRFIAMKRMQQNSVKQNYKEFSSWLASYYNIANLYLDKATITYIYYFKDHRRRDMDNMMLTPKFFNDGFVGYIRIIQHEHIYLKGFRQLIGYAPYKCHICGEKR